MNEIGTNSDVEGSASELRVDALVVSMSAVADASPRLDGVSRLAVPAKAIVTPAVRDFLRQRKIELVFQSNPKATAACGDPKKRTLRVVIADTSANEKMTGQLLKLLARSAFAVETIAPTDLIQAIDSLAKQLTQPATAGVLLTAETAAAACLSNRLKGVRGIVVGDASTLAGLSAAAKSIGANLMIIDPVGRGPFAIKPLIERFCQGAPRACPPQWQGRMD